MVYKAIFCFCKLISLIFSEYILSYVGLSAQHNNYIFFLTSWFTWKPLDGCVFSCQYTCWKHTLERVDTWSLTWLGWPLLGQADWIKDAFLTTVLVICLQKIFLQNKVKFVMSIFMCAKQLALKYSSLRPCWAFLSESPSQQQHENSFQRLSPFVHSKMCFLSSFICFTITPAT